MSVWLTAARAIAVVNIILLMMLGTIWLRNYRDHGAKYTLGLLVVATFLLIENLLWVYFYVFQSVFVGWFRSVPPEVQVGLSLLCGLELVALLALVRITWI